MTRKPVYSYMAWRLLAWCSGLAIVLGLGVTIGTYWRSNSQAGNGTPSTMATRDDVRRAFEEGEFERAVSMAEQLLEQSPDALQLRMLAAESASRSDQLDRALDHYARIPDQVPAGATARWAMAEIYYQQGKVQQALDALDQALNLDPKLLLARDRRASLLTTLGRRRESLSDLIELIRSDEVTVDQLLYIGNLAKEVTARGEIERLKKAGNDDLATNLPLAISAREQGDYVLCRQLLDQLLQRQPQLVEAHAQMGWLLIKVDPGRLADWRARLPAAAWQHPDVWAVHAHALQIEGRTDEAIASSLAAIERDPDHLAALTLAAQLLGRAGKPQWAQAFANRAQTIGRFNVALEQVYTSRRFLPPVRQAAELAFELGRLWESAGWCAYALSIEPDAPWPKELIARIRPQVAATTPRTLPEHNLALTASWRSNYPTPDIATAITTSRSALNAPVTPPKQPSSHGQTPAVALVDVAVQCGIRFQLEQPPRSRNDGKRMFEITGAGSGALDFDNDGWCDLFVVQAGREVPSFTGRGSPINSTDRLYRNLGGSTTAAPQFSDVTIPAKTSEHGFGQGVTIGDVNQDGFDDVYVANFGLNQLWINQGDGTFLDGNAMFITTKHELQEQWTVSAVIADFNADGLADIYDVNYVQGDEVTSRLCAVAGQMRACAPLVFAPARHALWLGQLDGGLTAFDGPGSELLGGYGLGIAVLRLSGSDRPHAFVAIDQQANLLLSLAPVSDAAPAALATSRSADWSLVDEALVRGVALDAEGRAQACMGVATGDVNGDGQTDIYVTNFYNESNTLYLQSQAYFSDVSARYALTTPSLPVLGFGTQMLDIQNDGWPDMLVLNGHIDDHSHAQTPYRMLPHLYMHGGSPTAPFTLWQMAESDGFFSRPGLGRSLTRIDIDADGLDDLVATDLESPLALLHNRSARQGQFLDLYLVGTQSDRNAFTAVATLSIGNWQQSQQLVAGSGYMASNQRRLRFTIPQDVVRGLDSTVSDTAGPAVRLQIEWPSGLRESITELQLGQPMIVVEGRHP